MKLRFVLITAAMLAAVMFVFSGCGGGGSATTAPTMNSTPTEVALGGNAKLVFPIGSIPTDANITVTEVASPLLTDDLTAVGTTYHISVDKQPVRPVEISLPVPLGEDPRNLVIVRVESNGRISMLGTSIDNDILVAKTPGFSAFVVTRLKEFYKDYRPKITGPEVLPVGTFGEYHESVSLSHMPGLQAKWEAYQFVDGAVKGLPVRSNNAIFENSSVSLSAAKASTVDLMVDVIEPITGLHAVASKTITIVDSLDSGDLKLDIAIDGQGVVKMDQAIRLQAIILNTDVTDIKEWTWSVDGVQVEQYKCDSNCSTVNIPFMLGIAPGPHTVTVTAVSDKGTEGAASRNLTVLNNDITLVTLDNETPLIINTDVFYNAEVEFTTEITGGVPPYSYNWYTLPEDVSNEHENINITYDSFETSFTQPGIYELVLEVSDSENNENSKHCFPEVEGSPMQTSLTGLPTSPVEINQPVTFTLKAWDSYLIYHGEKLSGYEYRVRWEDGESEETGTIPAINPKIGGSVALSHVYTTPGSKRVFIRVTPEGLRPVGLFSGIESLQFFTVNVGGDNDVEAGCIGGIKIDAITNTTYGDSIYNPTVQDIANAVISISGSAESLTINWKPPLDATRISVEGSTYYYKDDRYIYCIGGEMDGQGGRYSFSPPVQYGDYSIANTETCTRYEPSPPLIDGSFNWYEVEVHQGSHDNDNVNWASIRFHFCQ